jgi:hypothetical protein
MAENTEVITNENRIITRIGRLGKMKMKGSTKALLFADFLKANQPDPPKSFNFWKSRNKLHPFPLRMFGNDTNGNCTIASQANMMMRMERLETRKNPEITDNSVLSAYYDMTARLYGGGDTGAYETDALDNWRNPDWTFKDTDGNPLTIVAFTRINNLDVRETKRAIWSSPSKGIKICFNLPLAWSNTISPGVWDAPPTGKQPIGEWAPGSWGGHSMYSYAYGYTEKGIITCTWNLIQLVTWAGVQLYGEEQHWILDAVDTFKKKVKTDSGLQQVKIGDVIDAVNAVSSIKIGD